jgi:hypothetical protein
MAVMLIVGNFEGDFLSISDLFYSKHGRRQGDFEGMAN